MGPEFLEYPLYPSYIYIYIYIQARAIIHPRWLRCVAKGEAEFRRIHAVVLCGEPNTTTTVCNRVAGIMVHC